ncbi:MAG: hypothetical protein V3V92_01670 [Candidatus Hydrothermarchaeales archaeon]
MKKELDKIVGESGKIRLDEDVLAKIRTLNDSELEELEIQVKRRLFKKRQEFLQKTKSVRLKKLGNRSRVGLN